MSDSQKKFIVERGLDTHPEMVEIFAKLSGMMDEGKVRDGTGVNYGESVDTLNREIENVEKKIFSDLNSPHKDEWLAVRSKLYERRSAITSASQSHV